jgi:hypothetical protein
MKRPIAAGILTLGAITSFAIGCTQMENGENAFRGSAVVRELCVETPYAFVVENFKDRFAGSQDDLSLDVATVDDKGAIVFIDGNRRCEMLFELITVSRQCGQFTLGVNSQPMDLAEATAFSKALCGVVGIDNTNLTNWFSSRGYEDAVDTTCLQTGSVGKLDHSVEVRRSFESVKPWRVLYEVTFTDPRTSQAPTR